MYEYFVSDIVATDLACAPLVCSLLLIVPEACIREKPAPKKEAVAPKGGVRASGWVSEDGVTGNIPDVVDLNPSPANDGWSLHDHNSLHEAGNKKRQGATPKLWSVKVKASSRRGGKASEPPSHSPKSSRSRPEPDEPNGSPVSSISHSTTPSFRSASKASGAATSGLESPLTPRQRKDLKVKSSEGNELSDEIIRSSHDALHSSRSQLVASLIAPSLARRR